MYSFQSNWATNIEARVFLNKKFLSIYQNLQFARKLSKLIENIDRICKNGQGILNFMNNI